MNPYDEIAVGRLQKAMETSYRELMPFRNLTRGLVEEYAGSGYGRPNMPRHEILINLMNQTVDAYTMALVANRPRVLLSSELPELSYFSKQFQVAINNLIEEILLEQVLRQWVLDAFFCVGLVKVHRADAGTVTIGDLAIDPGRPMASNVSIDNWVHDMSATRWEQVKYAADSYRLPFSDLKGPQYDQEVVADLVPTSKRAEEELRLERISRGETVDQDELEPSIDLCDIWIPRDGKIYTFPLDNRGVFRIKSARPVAVMDDADGYETGPYHWLGFNDVPENIMPTSPASHLGSLARLANNLIRKQSRQAKRQKDVHTYTAAGKDSAQRAQRSNDGDWIQVNDVNEIGLIKMGGVDGANQAFLMGVIELFDRFAGNLTAMAGLGAQAPTASQESIVQGRVANKEAAMQYRVLDATSKLIRHLGCMLWHDKSKVIPARMPIEGAEGYSVDATWTPDDREGSFEDYRISIDVFSMAHQTPQDRVQAINGLITQIYAPLAPLLAQQGGQLNMQKLVELHADLLNLPQLRDVFQFVTVLPGEGADAEDGSVPAVPTTRRYVRENVATGGTPQNRSRMAQSEWINMAGQATPQQSAAMSMPGA